MRARTPDPTLPLCLQHLNEYFQRWNCLQSVWLQLYLDFS